MARYVAFGAALGAAILAVPFLLFDLGTPGDFEVLAVMTALSPLYLPIGALGIGSGFSKATIIAVAIASNAIVYGAAGWWLWRTRGSSFVFKAITIAVGIVALHIVTILMELY